MPDRRVHRGAREDGALARRRASEGIAAPGALAGLEDAVDGFNLVTTVGTALLASGANPNELWDESLSPPAFRHWADAFVRGLFVLRAKKTPIYRRVNLRFFGLCVLPAKSVSPIA